MASCIAYAVKRALVTLAAMLAVLGAMLATVLFGPMAELHVAPVVNEWRIVNATRTGEMLRWQVYVDKRRSCPPEIKWLARWGGETASLRVVGSTDEPFTQGLGVTAGERATLGPFTAPIPRGWEQADAIKIDAVVTYACGLPWRLPPINAQEQAAETQ